MQLSLSDFKAMLGGVVGSKTCLHLITSKFFRVLAAFWCYNWFHVSLQSFLIIFDNPVLSKYVNFEAYNLQRL